MRLLDLDPEFLKIIDDRKYNRIDDINDADGIMFLCPKCFEKNNGPIGTHRVICWQPHISQAVPPQPGRWQIIGTGMADLSLKAGSSSVLLKGGCNAHFFVREGIIVMT